jgi:eukaryotic-like serine/threonine-protein kinase
MQLSVTMSTSEDRPRIRLSRAETGEFAAGTVLGGSYRLIRRLGGGGMGAIHLASHERLPGQLVVKVLNPELVGDHEVIARFRQEAMVMANIRHPNIVQLVDFNLTPAGRPYLVMEYLPGENLAQVLATRELSAAEVSMIVRQVACALDAAHRLGIVHRDLKPENIMVVPCEGQGDLIKVIDFGISKARRLGAVTSRGMVLGTPDFMAPEQAQGRQESVEAPSDQFALAVISYLLLTGRMPWGVTAPEEILHCVANRYPLTLTQDETWRSVEAVLFRGMARAAADRYPSVLEFWRALDQAMIEDGVLPALSRPRLAPAGGESSAPPSRALAPKSEKAAPISGSNRQRRPPRTRRPRAKLRSLGWPLVGAATALLVLAFGAYLGVLGPRAVRERASEGWNALRTLIGAKAQPNLDQGHRLYSSLASGIRA